MKDKINGLLVTLVFITICFIFNCLVDVIFKKEINWQLNLIIPTLAVATISAVIYFRK